MVVIWLLHMIPVDVETHAFPNIFFGRSIQIAQEETNVKRRSEQLATT